MKWSEGAGTVLRWEGCHVSQQVWEGEGEGEGVVKEGMFVNLYHVEIM